MVGRLANFILCGLFAVVALVGSARADTPVSPNDDSLGYRALIVIDVANAGASRQSLSIFERTDFWRFRSKFQVRADALQPLLAQRGDRPSFYRVQRLVADYVGGEGTEWTHVLLLDGNFRMWMGAADAGPDRTTRDAMGLNLGAAIAAALYDEVKHAGKGLAREIGAPFDPRPTAPSSPRLAEAPRPTPQVAEGWLTLVAVVDSTSARQNFSVELAWRDPSRVNALFRLLK